MKTFITTFFTTVMLISLAQESFAQARRGQNSTSNRREMAIPEEYRVGNDPVGINMLIMDKKDVKEVKFEKVASHKNGKAIEEVAFESLEMFSKSKDLTLIVVFEAGAAWSKQLANKTTGDKKFNALLKQHNLQIVNVFSYDKKTRGLVLKPIKSLKDPVAASREISKVTKVERVEVKVPK